MATKKKTSDRDTLIIDRATWRSGDSGEAKSSTGRGETRLLNKQGFMCCLGFDALAQGLRKADILEQAEPLRVVACHLGTSVPRRLQRYEQARTVKASVSAGSAPHWKNNALVCMAISVNDDNSCTPRERERRLVPILKKLGYKHVRFVGKPVRTKQ